MQPAFLAVWAEVRGQEAAQAESVALRRRHLRADTAFRAATLEWARCSPARRRVYATARRVRRRAPEGRRRGLHSRARAVNITHADARRPPTSCGRGTHADAVERSPRGRESDEDDPRTSTRQGDRATKVAYPPPTTRWPRRRFENLTVSGDLIFFQPRTTSAVMHLRWSVSRSHSRPIRSTDASRSRCVDAGAERRAWREGRGPRSSTR